MKGPSTATCRFRYRGYRQNDTIREFTFEDVAEEKNAHPVLVDVDTELLRRHHVHFQDAPQLLLQLLTVNPPVSTVTIVVSDNELTQLLAESERIEAARKKRR